MLAIVMGTKTQILGLLFLLDHSGRSLERLRHLQHTESIQFYPVFPDIGFKIIPGTKCMKFCIITKEQLFFLKKQIGQPFLLKYKNFLTRTCSRQLRKREV
jgi:hypothetical protein